MLNRKQEGVGGNLCQACVEMEWKGNLKTNKTGDKDQWTSELMKNKWILISRDLPTQSQEKE